MKKFLSLFFALFLGLSAVPAFAANENSSRQQQATNASQNANSQKQNLNKINRMKFVRSIVDSKKECRNMYSEDKTTARDCFRGKVKDFVVERAKRLRETKKSCREEGVENLRKCSLQKYLNIRTEEKSDASENSSEEESEDENESGENSEDTSSDSEELEDASELDESPEEEVSEETENPETTEDPEV